MPRSERNFTIERTQHIDRPNLQTAFAGFDFALPQPSEEGTPFNVSLVRSCLGVLILTMCMFSLLQNQLNSNKATSRQGTEVCRLFNDAVASSVIEIIAIVIDYVSRRLPLNLPLSLAPLRSIALRWLDSPQSTPSLERHLPLRSHWSRK